MKAVPQTTIAARTAIEPMILKLILKSCRRMAFPSFGRKVCAMTAKPRAVESWTDGNPAGRGNARRGLQTAIAAISPLQLGVSPNVSAPRSVTKDHRRLGATKRLPAIKIAAVLSHSHQVICQ